jgi:PAS domain S-box-containing protein
MLRDRALESTGMGVVIADATRPDTPTVEVNSAFEHITGYSHDEIVGANCRVLNRRARDQEALARLRECLRQRRPVDVTLLNHRKDGSPFWNHLTISPLRDALGEVTHFVGVVRDVTAELAIEREREELLLQAQEAREVAERALGAYDEFLSVVSHELRSPLHSARLWASLLMEKGSKINPAEVGTHLVKSIDRQARLVSDLLDVSRFVGEKRLELDRHLHDLRGLTRSVVEHLSPVARERRVELGVELPDGPAVALVDPDRFAQVIGNLVENAIKFTPAGGRAVVSLSVDGHEALIRVADTGCGLTPADRERVFGRFWHGRQAKGGSGLGLGLFIAKRLVEAHGGTIAADSPGPNQGTVLSVRMPLAEPAPPPAAAAPRTMPTSPDRMALVVDDDPSACSALAWVLAAHGWTVETAASAEEALASLEERPASLLISDVILPGMSGLQLIRELRAHQGTETAHVAIAVSGKGGQGDRRAALDAGFDAFIPKPVRPEVLLQLIAALTTPPQTAPPTGSGAPVA